MKNEIMQRLAAVISAMNSISVMGKMNMANLVGSISAMEEIAGMLDGVELIRKEQSADGEKKSG